MTLDNNRQLAAQQVFGPQATVYATSKVHIRDDSLEAVERMVDAASGTNRYGWTIDLGTGAGFTAFAVAGVSDRVIASDVTEPMLRQAQRLGRERGIANLDLSQNAAEALPFANESVDLITSRVSAHHFRDFEKALDEAQRVLKSGGSLLMADSVAPEDDDITDWMNEIELRRDFSHVENRKISKIQEMLAGRGFTAVENDYPRIYLRFNEWTARTKVSLKETAALRKDFLEAPAATQEAFQVAPVHDDIAFSWPCWVFLAVKR
ncbi:MAG: class I SAM-dependent methyltransferase [Chloroflexota bacterium]|uniref:Methyltransferase type 11 domain-containing protein n=1 Tax=marine metagenome TaxID=408172 RepID=A0A381QL42_9ZZZZ|nr:class I SAM-dependent methyltransferase [Chloroflexota bacterium]